VRAQRAQRADRRGAEATQAVTPSEARGLR